MIQRSQLPRSRFLGDAQPSLAGSCRSLFAEMSHLFLYQPLLLLAGETGVGKAYLARYLCSQQANPQAGVQELNCRLEPAAVQSWLLTEEVPESPEMPAASDRVAIVLLREIEALSQIDQQRLLQRIEQNSQDYPPTQRLLLTSRTDLAEAVRRLEFRDDLFYRLSMFRFEIPPLRERTNEIPRLIREFALQYADRYQKSIERIDESLIRQLTGFAWPGNIRQLEHVIERAVIFSHHGTLTAAHLPSDLFPRVHSPPPAPFQAGSKAGSMTDCETPPVISAPVTSVPASSPQPSSTSPSNIESAATAQEQPGPVALETFVADTERKQIEHALQRNLQSRTRAARELGISRVTLYNKMKKHGLETQKAN